MEVYKCERCNKIFEKKLCFDNHMKRKIPCKIQSECKTTTENKLEMQYINEKEINAQLRKDVQDLKKTVIQMQEDHKKLCRIIKKIQEPKCESYIQNNTLKLVVQEEEFELWTKQFIISKMIDSDIMDEKMKDFVKSTMMRMNFPTPCYINEPEE